MRSTMRASGRVTFAAAIHSANVPESSVASDADHRYARHRGARLPMQVLARLGVLSQQRVVEFLHIVDQGAHMRIVFGGERGAVAHHDEVGLLNADAVDQAGRVDADVIGLLGLLGELGKPLLELADRVGLIGQMRPRPVQEADRFGD